MTSQLCWLTEPASSTRYASKQELSKYKIPLEGAPAEAVHQMLKDELDLDGRPNLNLASFVGTYMEKEAEALIMENISKNMSDADEYPAMMKASNVELEETFVLTSVCTDA